MRIISGSARGRRLVAPKGMATRPTPDRVKESLFSILGGELVGAQVLDLFAGTGALGLEALSRGAQSAVFVEADRAARVSLEQNIATVGHPATEVLPMSAERAMSRLAAQGRQFDLIFLDPPFDAGLLVTSLTELQERGLLLPSVWMVCEHRTHDAPPAPPPGLVLHETRAYGDVSLSFVTKGPPP